MRIIAIDLGTTNIKAAGYTSHAQMLCLFSHPVKYERDGVFVEFDAERYFDEIVSLIKQCQESEAFKSNSPVQIVLTGQAESLVILGRDGRPARKGISWLDMRTAKECEDLKKLFPPELSYPVTGQPEIIPTWPLTKILWVKRNEPAIFASAAHFLLLKDYIQYRLTGVMCGEHSIYPFSHYFDVTKKEYWEAPLAYCGVSKTQLPELTPPCSVVGNVLPALCRCTGLPEKSFVNAGTLDHFAGMIGTGNLKEGTISESAGTVSSIATFVSVPAFGAEKIPAYCGPFPESYIYLPVCESGGISLEWFAGQIMGGESFPSIDIEAAKRNTHTPLTFLPYLTGVNPPEFDPDATGVFFGLRAGHDKYDMALAIMTGVACLLRKNIDYFRKSGIHVDSIISTGGGAKSALWSQIKADITGIPVVVPRNEEAPCLGAAVIGAVTTGAFASYESAVQSCVSMKNKYLPGENRTVFEAQYRLFLSVYDFLRPAFKEASSLTALN
jgi:sugar (pentulose or hexulose) kinase